ncbi:uncharacterized protein PpBr36_09962 [Pyricularia pennisetigena]|uniref:uncharacterized protein n=1 Tax=Pyricularia pennisetigena TaxID=1578925 RepID=UPI00114EAA7D|nr:uncharacterized protein PpBr36_09962 [Pyricularia pennisetigena]TLS22158.1 hypothetical protein PpBr36_09962 [Pyricularia pennisetigena]
MPPKRPRTDPTPIDLPIPPPGKKARTRRDAIDRISLLSDEILVRVLSFLSVPQLLSVSLVSHRLGRLACDSQLWKALYYARFVLPRAMRIPGFDKVSTNNQLHYAGRRTLWADGRRGGIVDVAGAKQKEEHGRLRYTSAESRNEGSGRDDAVTVERVDWKRQFKIRHNWSRGKCAVEELNLGECGREESTKRKMLAKVVEGIAVTADDRCGLRAWDLKTRRILARTPLSSSGVDDNSVDEAARRMPTCIAVDDQGPDIKMLHVCVGFQDGSFGIWMLQTTESNATFEPQYLHEQSSNGSLISMAYSHPYLLTANKGITISLYTFEGPSPLTSSVSTINQTKWTPPYLLTSLKSHTSTPPLALSIRQAGITTIASIAYTFSTVQGWSIGIQDLHIKATSSSQTPEITATRLAYTAPMTTGSPRRHVPLRRSGTALSDDDDEIEEPVSSTRRTRTPPAGDSDGPTTLCYTHPYLLATLPDNTLLLHLCTTTSTSLSISSGIRLWGHTSGISDAEITSRGRAVSVSQRGDEMRVWELEGGARQRRVGDHRSIEIRPTKKDDGGADDGVDAAWEERRDWVGFDDEMVIVLKERLGGDDSLMVYDFT